MSFRHTYITDFIYDAQEGWEDRKKKMIALSNFPSKEKITGSIIGKISGLVKSGYPQEPLVNGWFEDIVRELENITIVPFRITFMCEDGPVITYEVNPKTNK